MTEEANGNTGYTHLIGTEGSYAGTITLSGIASSAEVKLLLATGTEAEAKTYAAGKVAIGEKLRTLATPAIFTKIVGGWE